MMDMIKGYFCAQDWYKVKLSEADLAKAILKNPSILISTFAARLEARRLTYPKREKLPPKYIEDN